MFSQLHEEIVQAIKDAEEGLLHLKRARLLREADLVLDGSAHADEDVKVETLDPTDVEPEPLEEPSYTVGSKCRFCHTDGRWYNGQVIGLDGSNSAKISFLTPTSENMLVRTFTDPLSILLIVIFVSIAFSVMTLERNILPLSVVFNLI